MEIPQFFNTRASGITSKHGQTDPFDRKDVVRQQSNVDPTQYFMINKNLSMRTLQNSVAGGATWLADTPRVRIWERYEFGIQIAKVPRRQIFQ